ncbi:GNAT family N-acetyltransferase [Flavobacterium subsaxonicum]|nr:GNAT family N-acetyltransferase [Flavobacterium subsaxonicum]
MQTPALYFTKDGKEVIIRHAVPNDALQLLELKKSYIKDTRSIPLYEYEYKNGIQQEKELIEKYIAEGNSLLLVAEHGNNLIGNLDLTGSHRKKMYHTAMLGMGIAYAWQNRKVGSFLLKSALNWATTKSQLHIIWLEVYSNNAAGIKLYEKCGFETCGFIKDFFNEDAPVDKITMVNYLK